MNDRERMAVIPGVLDLGFVSRVDEYVTNQQFNRLAMNCDRQGLIPYLGADAAAAPWSAFMEVMDGINGAQAVYDREGPPELTKLQMQFVRPRDRERFHTLFDLMLAGIGGLNMPHFRSYGVRDLYAENFGYPEACTAGRIGAALFRRQYPSLGQNFRFVLRRTIGEISEYTNYLPPDLRDRVIRQRNMLDERMGAEAAADTLLTSGMFSIVGRAVREELKRKARPLEIQRPQGFRPHVEQGSNFYNLNPDAAIPLSGTTLGLTLAGQVRERIDDMYRGRDPLRIAEALWNIAAGLGITEGIGSAARALGTMSAATVVALWGKVADARLEKLIGRSGVWL